MANVEKIVQTYKTLSKIPALIGGRITRQNAVQSVWSQRNLDKGKTSKFQRTSILSSSTKIGELPPVDISSELLAKFSPSEKLKAIIRESGTDQFLEIWSSSNLLRSVDLNAADVHGAVYTDIEFAGLEWSPDEKHVVYVVEQKIPKSEPFYKRKQLLKPTSEDDNTDKKPQGEEFLYRQDWGEQLVGKIRSVLARYNIEDDVIEILEGVPEDLCVAMPKYSSDGQYLIGIAYETQPRKLGLIYCSNRASSVFKLDFSGNFEKLSLDQAAMKSARFVPENKGIIWLQRQVGGPHDGASSLMFQPTNGLPKEIVPIIRNTIKISNNVDFNGLYNHTFPQRCWASQSRLILSSCNLNTINSYCINIDNGTITELTCPDASLVVLDVFEDQILAAKRNFLQPDKLVIGKLQDNNTIDFIELTESIKVDSLDNSTYEYLNLTASSGSFKNFSAIYLGPKEAANKSTPLVLYPHGGPHSSFGNYFFLDAAMYLSLNHALLLINYRGSTGQGEDSIQFLPGNLEASVDDCMQALETALTKYPCLDPNRVSLVGGSHGGFLVTLISGIIPDKFKAVVARNPVIDIASMSITSDIPDWCYVEGGKEYNQIGEIDNEILLNMRKASPIMHAHKVKAPTLLQIGSKDLRVPPHQGLDYYHRLKSNGCVVRMNLYDDNHPLGTVPNEMDNIINSIKWIQEHSS